MKQRRAELTELGNWLWLRLPIWVERMSPFHGATAGWRLKIGRRVELERTIAGCIWQPYDATPNVHPMKPWQPFILDYWKARLTLGPWTLSWRRYANRYGYVSGT